MSLSAKEIGNRIKKYRNANHLKQKELAQILDCAEMTISQYERGLYAPKTDMRIKLANALGVSYSDLFEDQKPMAFDSSEDFEKAKNETAKQASESDSPNIAEQHRADGTVKNEARYRFEANDLSAREKDVFDSLYSLLRNKDENATD